MSSSRDDGTIRLWDTGRLDLQSVNHLCGHEKGVLSIATSEDWTDE